MRVINHPGAVDQGKTRIPRRVKKTLKKMLIPKGSTWAIKDVAICEVRKHYVHHKNVPTYKGLSVTSHTLGTRRHLA